MNFPTHPSTACHWVLKVGNLKDSIDFFTNVLGLRVLRHEEFSSGCEATCNGPYGGAWSKTMVGYGPEDSNFVLELTYNYGIDSYAQGNDLLYIAVACPAALVRAGKKGGDDNNDNIITSPDGYRFKILPLRKQAEQFVCVALRVADLHQASSYYTQTLGMTLSPGPESDDALSCLVSFAPDQVGLLLVQSPAGETVDHALSSGRIAFACPTPSVNDIYSHVTARDGIVQTPPLTLPTPGKADVVVTILVDRDGYEICFVEDRAFFALAQPCWDVIDWAERGSRGGDGLALPATVHEHLAGVRDVASSEEWASLIAGSKRFVVEFGADWCKNCKRVGPKVSELAQSRSYVQAGLQVLRVDVDSLADVALDLGVSSIPRFMVFIDGSKTDDYTGADEAAIEALFAKATSV